MTIRKNYVHNGVFHCDDVMCVAIMKSAFPDIEVQRTNRPPKIYGNDVIVADIGFGKYDHHQPNAELRPDGKKYAACGLVFRDFWQNIFPKIMVMQQIRCPHLSFLSTHLGTNRVMLTSL